MSKKNKVVHSNRVYPIKVCLAKPNKMNVDKLVINGINLYTFKDTEIKNVETLMKLKSVHSMLIIKSELKESEVEIKDEVKEEIKEEIEVEVE